MLQQIIWAPPRSLHQSYNFCLWKIIFLAISCIAEHFVLASIFYRISKIELHIRLLQCEQVAQVGINDCALSSPVRWWCVKVMQAVQVLDYNIWVYPPVSIMCARSGWFYAPSTHFDVHCADHELHQFDQLIRRWLGSTFIWWSCQVWQKLWKEHKDVHGRKIWWWRGLLAVHTSDWRGPSQKTLDLSVPSWLRSISWAFLEAGTK